MSCKKNIPIVKRTYLSDGGFLTSLVGSSKQGGQKMQFPYELPEIKVAPVLPPETKKALYITVGIFSAGMITSALIKKLNP